MKHIVLLFTGLLFAASALCAPLSNLVPFFQAQATGPSDPYWANVVLLLGNDNAANGSTTFTDQSGSAHTVTVGSGSVAYSSTTAPSGMTTSMYANTGYLTSADSSDWNFGSGDFTLEAYVYWSGTGKYFPVIFQGTTVTSNFAFDMLLPNIGTDNNAYLIYSTNGTADKGINPTAWAPSITTWYHVAMVRHGVDLMFFVNGTQVGTTFNISSDTVYNSTAALRLFSDLNSRQAVGYMVSTRVTKGVARYTTTFTPPSLPLPTH